MLKLSLIIPVYNEERHIKACLDAVSKQIMMPDEVLVVDNNCTDNTLIIAEKFPFVTIIKEDKQGLIAARDTGFRNATGGILGRIDADSEIDKDWVKNVVNHFSSDDKLQGLTGLARTSFFPYLEKSRSKIFSRVYFWYVNASFNTEVMWGANMAIRKSAWEKIRDKTSEDDKAVHEDQDLSLCLASRGMKIKQLENVIISTSGQTYRYLPKLFYYYSLQIKTKRLHIENGNLISDKVIRIGYFRTWSSRTMAFLPSIFLVFTSIVLFPFDFIMNNYKK